MAALWIMVASALLAFPARAGTQEFVTPLGKIVLLDMPCDQPDMVESVKPQLRGRMKIALEGYEDKRWKGCWLEYNGSVVLMWPDGAVIDIPVKAFRDVPGT